MGFTSCCGVQGHHREKRKKLEEEWQVWVNEWKRSREEEIFLRQALRDGEPSEEEEEYEEEEVEAEEVLDVTEDVASYGF
ncbi:hypothetical protein SUGI_1142100 [Cryptomeria japonica]|nr:hypothetical protein SUGI_1142100 [Cryptomeria japonica]